MRYLDRNNEPLSREQWWRLFMDADYCRVRSFRNDDLTLLLDWVGVFLPSIEEKPKPFVLIGSGKHALLTERLRSGVWLLTETQGILAFEQALNSLIGS